MNHRILILSASVGAGHTRAAQAVELALRQVAPDAHVENIDILALAGAAFRRVYGKAYLDLVNKAPHVLGYFYDRMDKTPSSRRKGDRLRLALEKLNLRGFTKFLNAQPWGLVINTHFLPAEIIASLKKKGRFAAPQVTVTTDFEVHRLWVNQPCEHYFAATREGAITLQHAGIPAGDITVTGIPIHPAFAEDKPRAACIARQKLAGKSPIVLLLAGGFGVGPIAEIYQSILTLEQSVEVVAVCGRNEALKKKIAAIDAPRRHRTHVLGFTDQIDELMAAADVVVTKPGGLTTSETLARGLPMVIVNPIPGQESRNSDFLLENGAAIKINHIVTLGYKLGALLGDGPRLAAMRSKAKSLGKPRAAFDIVEKSLEFMAR